MFEAPLTAEKLADMLSILRQGLEQLLGDQLEAVYLYGSHARGDGRPDSDIDVLVVLRGEFNHFKFKRKSSTNTEGGDGIFYVCERVPGRSHTLSSDLLSNDRT